jgi:chromatin segregation and condensation protein Rec8/ScpA/Scc1 (kleisin family)
MKELEILRLTPLFRSLRHKIERSEIDLEESMRDLSYGSELVVLKLRWLLPEAGLKTEEEPDDDTLGKDETEGIFEDIPIMSLEEVSKATQFLAERFSISSRTFPRGYTVIPLVDAKSVVSIDVLELKKAMIDVKKRSLPVRKALLATKWNFMNHLRQFWREVRGLLSGNKVLSFSRFVRRGRREAIMSFLALLELVKRRRIMARQLSLFGEIEFTTTAAHEVSATATDPLITLEDQESVTKEGETS